MSGQDIPYQLRPNKFIDRQMFLELLSRLTVPRGVEKYIYASMGGRHLIDHYAVYNHLGIGALYSFDKDPNEVKRQIFNRPTGSARCVALDSADLPSKIDEIVEEFSGKDNMIVWLDYTAPHRRTQFQETIQTLLRLKHGDIFRITLNADQRTLGAESWKRDGFSSPGECRASKLRQQIDEYMPTNVQSLLPQEIPTVLVQCLKLAVGAAEAQAPNLQFHPVLITTYRDGTQMLTVTLAVAEAAIGEEFPTSNFSHWRFACKNWGDVRQIYAPVLSTKEQHRLDARVHRSPKFMLQGFKFLLDDDEEKTLDALKSYREFHRFYPSFHHVED